MMVEGGSVVMDDGGEGGRQEQSLNNLFLYTRKKHDHVFCSIMIYHEYIYVQKIYPDQRDNIIVVKRTR